MGSFVIHASFAHHRLREQQEERRSIGRLPIQQGTAVHVDPLGSHAARTGGCNVRAALRYSDN